MPAEQSIRTALDESVAYLASPAAVDSIRADPYWPKWDSPWWRMTLLWEMGHAARIPASAVDAMIAGLATHFLPDFPQTDELPPGVDPYRQIVCHCAVGTMFQVLHACAVDVDGRLPWMRDWLHRYQLPDGGLNCDERAYAKPGGKSSMVSTVPALEAVLRCTAAPWSERDTRFLARGADYLMRHRLVRRAGGDGSVIDRAWLEPTFPRFYFYDVLRGLSFLTEWADATGSPVLRDAIADALDLLEHGRAPAGGVTVRRRAASTDQPTMERTSGTWQLVQASGSFALLDLVGRPGRVSPELTAELERAGERLDRLRSRGLLVDGPVV